MTDDIDYHSPAFERGYSDGQYRLDRRPEFDSDPSYREGWIVGDAEPNWAEMSDQEYERRFGFPP
jgi:hypothetical protein